MSMFTLVIYCLTTSNLPWFMDLTFQVPMQYCSLQNRILLLSRHIHNWVLFLLWLHLFILSRVISQLISTIILGTYRPGEFLFQYPIILPLHTVYGVLKVKNTEVVCHSLLQWRVPEKHLFLLYWLCQSIWLCGKLWKILKEMGIPVHLTCLLSNLYAGQQTTVRTGHGTTDWFQIGKEARQGCMLSLCLFNIYTEYIMRNPGLEKSTSWN